jgi:hypothetical protein
VGEYSLPYSLFKWAQSRLRVVTLSRISLTVAETYKLQERRKAEPKKGNVGKAEFLRGVPFTVISK